MGKHRDPSKMKTDDCQDKGQNISRRVFAKRVSASVAATSVGATLLSGCESRQTTLTSEMTPTNRGAGWPYWGGDQKGTRFSPLKQINKDNVHRLQHAWTYHTGDISDGTTNPTRTAFECTPIVVDGRMFIVTPFGRAVALDPETGKELWVYDPQLDLNKRYNLWANRGAVYWRSGNERRLLYGTLDGRLIALNAETGRPCPDFGQQGTVYVNAVMTSPPTIYRDLVIVGGTKPVLNAYHVRNGQLAWTFHKVPPTDERAKSTWAGDSWKHRRGSVAWAPLSVDEERGMLFVPTDSPTYDYYGGDRAGDNLYANCVLALEVTTGKLIWHFQTSHHDIWDYDLPAQPVLIQVRRGTQQIPAVAQITKQGFVFVLDRLTGEPLFPVEERSVPASHLPAEVTSPTQPFPTKPAPFARQSMTLDELSTVTTEHHAWARELADKYPLGSLYHPGTLEGVIIFPSNQGGGEWGGAAFDPQTQRLYVNGTNLADILAMENTYLRRQIGIRQNKFWDPKKLWPCQQPPWGTLTAFDTSSGETVWQVPLGVVEELVEKGIPPTGTINIGGPIVTAGGLVFIGASNDSRFRAFDRDTGKELWVAKMDGSGHAVPMTYQGPKSGRQYVVIAAGGGNKLSHRFTDALVAFALP